MQISLVGDHPVFYIVRVRTLAYNLALPSRGKNLQTENTIYFFSSFPRRFIRKRV
jgi:hypothetical protein